MPVKDHAKLIVRAVHVFRDVEQAENWLNAPNSTLSGQTPLEALKTEAGAVKVEEQLSGFAETGSPMPEAIADPRPSGEPATP